jgi:hypothetical protein
VKERGQTSFHLPKVVESGELNIKRTIREDNSAQLSLNGAPASCNIPK